MLNSFLRKTALLALLGSGVAVAQDEQPAAAEPAAAAPAATTSGWTIANVPELTSLWVSQAVLNPTRDTVSFFRNDESIVYVQSSAGTVTAFNAESGREFWAAQIGRVDEVSLPIASNRQTAVIASGLSLHGLNKFTGQRLFSFRLPETPRGGPVLLDEAVVIPTGAGAVSAFTLRSLNHLGRLDVLPDDQASALDWRFNSGELIQYPPVAGRDRVAYATDAGNIFAISVDGSRKGHANFQFLMNRRATAPMAVVTRNDEELLLAVSADNRLFCIELQRDGVMRWTAPLSRMVFEPIIAVGNDVYVLSEDGELHCFDLRTGAPQEVISGSTCMVSRAEEVAGRLPTFGSLVQLQLEGSPEFHPFRLSNRSTGQSIRSITIDLTTAASNLTFSVDEQQQPVIRLARAIGQVTPKSLEVSADRKTLTMTFSDFVPSEMLEFHADLEHPEKPAREIRDTDLSGARVTAQMSVARGAAGGPAHRLFGEFRTDRQSWKIEGIESMVAVSDDMVYAIEDGGLLTAFNRGTGERLTSRLIPEYTMHIRNSLTDRLYLGTTSGRVECLAESRIELGVLPVATAGGITWIPYPETQLSPDFAAFHQRPEDRPIMPDVPEGGNNPSDQ